jgi:hypothetical protein
MGVNVLRQIWAYRGLTDAAKWDLTMAYLAARLRGDRPW